MKLSEFYNIDLMYHVISTYPKKNCNLKLMKTNWYYTSKRNNKKWKSAPVGNKKEMNIKK